MEGYLSVKIFAEKWQLKPRRVREMCAEGKLSGAVKNGRDWSIPEDTERPIDGRVTSGAYVNWRKSTKIHRGLLVPINEA